MGKACRHIHHEVQPQRNIWEGARLKRTEPGQVFCRDCKQWLYEKPMNLDLLPTNSAQREEAYRDHTRASERAAGSAGVAHPTQR